MSRPVAAVVIGALLYAAPAASAVLYSAPVVSGFAGNHLICLVHNLSPVARQVTFEHVDLAGNVVLSPGTYTVPPGETQTVSANPVPSAASCRITVAGSAKTVRASAAYYDPGESRVTVVLPVE
jgi:hypothetical protein